MTLLADVTARVTVVLLVSLIGAAALRRRSAALRHWALTAGLLCSAAVPAISVVMPAWPVAPAVLTSRETPSVRLNGPAAPVDVTTDVITQIGVRALAEPPASGAGVRLVQPVVLSLWTAGTLLVLARLGMGLWRLSRLSGRAHVVTDATLSELAERTRGALGIRRRVTLLQDDRADALLTWGVVRPRVILPAGAATWSPERMAVVLRHELAHVARGDWPAQMLAEALRAAYWFNPLCWLACRRLRADAERACDDAVLATGVSATDYASHLLELARAAARHRQREALGLAMARATTLEGRITAMLSRSVSRGPVRSAARVAVLAALVAITVPVALAQTRFASFRGTVTDQTQRTVADVTLRLANESGRATYEVRTDAAGHFEFAALPPGEYELAVQQPGFKAIRERIAVAGLDLARSFQLAPGSVQETITISSGGTGAPGSDPQPPVVSDAAQQRAQVVRKMRQRECAVKGDAQAAGGQVLPPLKVIDVRPVYPETAKANGFAGTVTLDAVIGIDGTVKDVTTVSSPHPDLERAATDAVQRWEFTATYLNCTPVEAAMRVTITFKEP